jgi:hypothetical protein
MEVFLESTANKSKLLKYKSANDYFKVLNKDVSKGVKGIIVLDWNTGMVLQYNNFLNNTFNTNISACYIFKVNDQQLFSFDLKSLSSSKTLVLSNIYRYNTSVEFTTEILNDLLPLLCADLNISTLIFVHKDKNYELFKDIEELMVVNDLNILKIK